MDLYNLGRKHMGSKFTGPIKSQINLDQYYYPGTWTLLGFRWYGILNIFGFVKQNVYLAYTLLMHLGLSVCFGRWSSHGCIR